MNGIWLVCIGAAFVLVFVLKRLSFVSSETARQYLQQGALVVDVRSAGEYQGEHLPGAVNIPLGELRESLPRRVKDKNQFVLLHCLSGTRSGIAQRQLKSLGYQNVFNLGSYGRAKKIVGGVSSPEDYL